MLGKRRGYKANSKKPGGKSKDCNIWKQRGIYALYRNFEVVYVGQANADAGIGSRLSDHAKKSRFNRQWDSFSWFSFDGFDDQGKPTMYETKLISADTIARTLELVTILIANPPLNRSRGQFKGAEKVDQGQSKQTSNQEVIRKMQILLESVAKD